MKDGLLEVGDVVYRANGFGVAKQKIDRVTECYAYISTIKFNRKVDSYGRLNELKRERWNTTRYSIDNKNDAELYRREELERSINFKTLPIEKIDEIIKIVGIEV